jgi:hypothetical protein
MRNVRTTYTSAEIEEELQLLVASGAELVMFIDHANGTQNVLGRWAVGEYFRPSIIARTIQRQVDRDAAFERILVVEGSKEGRPVDRFFVDKARSDLAHDP